MNLHFFFNSTGSIQTEKTIKGGERGAVLIHISYVEALSFSTNICPCNEHVKFSYHV